MDEVLARFARAEALGFHTAWSGQVFAHDVAVVGNGAAIDARLDALACLGVSDFNAVTFPVPGDPDVEDRTRSWLAGRAVQGA